MLNTYQYYYCFGIERYSIEWRKTKIKVITLANHKASGQSREPIKSRSNYMQLTQKRGKTCAIKSRFVFMRLDEKWREFFSQSFSVVDPNHFDTQFMKTALSKDGQRTQSMLPVMLSLNARVSRHQKLAYQGVV